MDVGDGGVFEQAADQCVAIPPFAYIGIQHLAFGVIGAQRQQPDTHHLGDFADTVIACYRAFTDEDRV